MSSNSSGTGRLAPTPSGELHLGNILAFGAAWLDARSRGDRLLLRVEDLDPVRSKADLAQQHREELQWLGITWDEEVAPQSSRTYDHVRSALDEQTYRCTCSRKTLQTMGGRYDGRCRDAKQPTGALRWRLPETPVALSDLVQPMAVVDVTNTFGDPVLVRKDDVSSYLLAIVADDAADGVTRVVRGADLYTHTALQHALRDALALPHPATAHTPMVVGPDLKKLGKSHGSSSIRAWRDAGHTPEDVWRFVLPMLGLDPQATLLDALPNFSWDHVPAGTLKVHEDRVGPCEWSWLTPRGQFGSS